MVGMEVTGFADFKHLSGAERDEAVQRALVGMRQSIACVAEMIAAVSESRSFIEDGHGSVNAWFRAVANCSGPYASRMVRTSRVLAELDHVAGEFHDGLLGECQVAEIARLFANRKCRDELGRGQYPLVNAAQDQRFGDFKKVAGRFKAVVDPDGTHREHKAAHEGRSVAAGHVGESFFLNATCGNVQGQRMLKILNRFAHAEYLADLADLKERCGENAPLIMMRRTAAQRRLDALDKIFITAATNPLNKRRPVVDNATVSADSPDNATGNVGGRGMADPVVNFLIDPQTFTNCVTTLLGGQPVGTGDLTDQQLWERVRNYRSETTDGVPVDLYLIVAAAINGRVRGIVADASGVVLDAGRTRRFFTGAQRDVLMSLWLRCYWPGCDVPGEHCQIDHLIGFTRHGGETRSRNAGPGCGRHNRDKEEGFSVWLDDEGVWHVYRPDGTEIAPLLGDSIDDFNASSL